MNNTERSSGGLVVIIRNANGQVVTRITSRYELAGALRTACSILKLKLDVVRAEVHPDEGPASTYPGKPLATISTDDLVLIRHQQS
jgi:hypothetical protein